MEAISIENIENAEGTIHSVSVIKRETRHGMTTKLYALGEMTSMSLSDAIFYGLRAYNSVCTFYKSKFTDQEWAIIKEAITK